MYSCLPREIRNRIYAFCVQGPLDNEVIVRSVTPSRRRIALLLREKDDFQTYRWTEDPFASLLDVQSLGADCACELLEAYYWNRVFKFDSRQITCLGTFLESDLFGLRMRPAEYIRSLQLQIRPLLYATMECTTARQREQNKCCEALKMLAMMRNMRPSISLVIDLAAGSMDEARYRQCIDDSDHFLLALLNTLLELKAQSLRIDLTYTTTWNDSRGTTIPLDSISPVENWIPILKMACKIDQPSANL